MSGRSSLNHIYRTVWNQSLGAMVAVAEIATAGGRSSGAASSASSFGAGFGLKALATGIAIAWGASPALVLANPSGGVVIAGQATMASTGSKLLVTTQNAVGTNHSAINWQSFSVPQGSSTYFQQPSATSTSINRVITATPTQLFGSLGSNGNLVLVNQAGITVGAGAVVDTAGFTASALQMSEADALAGRLRFAGAGGSGGTVSVGGNVLARSGDVVLLGSNIATSQDALVQAPNGATILVAGAAVSISSRGLEGINFDVQAAANSAVNLGSLKGNAVGVFAGTLKHSGLIQAQTLDLVGGKVVLKASGDAMVEGQGSILATGIQGGLVDVLGSRVALADQALIDASGSRGGGAVRVGGDYQGKNAQVANSTVTYVGPQTKINADAIETGDGGKVIVWADDTSRFYGGISAKGGDTLGNGGFVEVSGKRILDFSGLVNTSALGGVKGTLFLDPVNVYIAGSQALATAAGMVTTDAVDAGGAPLSYLAPSGVPNDSLLLTAVLESALSTNDVTVNQASSGYGGSILVASNIAKNSGSGTSTLKLIANGNVIVNSGVSIGSDSSSRPLSVVLNADSSGSSGGAIVLNSGSSIVSKGGNITLGGGANPATTSAVGNGLNQDGVYLNIATLDAEAGAISIRGTAESGTSTGKAGVSIVDSTVKTTSGAITINGSGGGSAGYSDKYGIYIARGTLESDTGNITLSGTGGSAGNSNNYGVFLDGGVMRSNTNSAISITGNGGVGTTGPDNIGVNLSGGTSGSGLTVSALAGSISIVGNGTGSGTNSFGVQAIGTSGKPVNITSAGAASIALDGTSVGSTSNGIVLNGSAASVALGGASTSGNIAITFDGNTISSKDIDFGTGVSLRSTGALTIKPGNVATTIGIGSSTAYLSLSSTDIAAFQDGFSEIIIGSATQSGGITATNATFTDSLTLKAGAGAVNAAGPLTSVGTGNTIRLESGSGGVGGDGITVDNLVVTSSGLVNFSGSNNAVGKFSATITGSNTDQANYFNTGAMVLGRIDTVGGLNLKSFGGAISQTAEITTGSGTNTTIDSGAGNIALTNGANNFASLNVTSSGTVDIHELNAVDLGTVSAGSFKLTAGGNIERKGPGSVSSSAGGIEVTSTTGSITAAQGVSFSATGSTSTNGTIKFEAANGLQLTNTGAPFTSFTANATGDAVVVVASGGTSSVSGATFSTANGRWLAYLGDPVALPAGATFKQYNTTFGSSVLGSGSGVIFDNSSVATLTAEVRMLTGSVSKVYDGGLSIGLSGAVYASLMGIGGDDASNAVVSGGTGTLSDANVGTGKFVTATGMTATGVTNGGLPVYGYQVDSFTGNIAEVTPARAIASINLAGTRVYDGTNIVNAPIFTLSGLVGSETLGLLGSGTVADKNVGTNKPVSLGSLSLSDGSGLASNYTLSGGTAVATISPVAIGPVTGITATNKVYDGTTTATVSTSGAVLAGKVVGDVLGVTATAAAFVDKNVGLGKQIGVAGLVLNGADAANYRLTSTLGTAAASIVAKPLTLGAVSAANKVYDGTSAAVVSGGTLSGVVAGDSVSLGALSGTFVDKNVGAAKQVTVAGLALSGADALNYNLLSTTVTASADITAKALIAGAFSALNRTYDGTRVASVSGGALSGAVAGDSVSLSPFVGSFADKAAGVSKAVTIDGLALSGADAGNYSLAKTTGTATASIAPKALSASGFVAANKIYDGAVAATVTGGVLSGAVAGDSVGLGLVTASFDSKNAGLAKLVTVSTGSLSGADAGNYSLSNAGPALRANIEAKPVSVSGLAAANKVYDGTLAASVAGGSVVGALAGDAVGVSIASSTFADKNKGTGKAVTVTGIALAGANATNYVLSTTGAVLSANIAAKPLTVGSVVASSKVYDGNNSAVVSGGSLVGAIAGDNVSLGALSGSFLDKNAGNNKPVIVSGLVLGGADGGNYSLAANSVSTTANITRKLLDVSALTAANKIYDGGTVATLSGGALSGAVVGDSIALAPAVGAFADKNVGTNKSVSISGLSLTGADVANYSLSAASLSTTASIAPKPLVVSGITAASKEYDGKTDAAIVTSAAVMGGLVAGDAVTTGAITAAFADKNAGVGKKVLLTGLGLIGADAGNYTFSSDSVTTADIRVRPVSNWLGGSSGVWSDVKNWDALPDGSNVLAVNFPAATTNVTLDALAGSVSLQSLNLGGTLSVTGGSLQVASSVTTAGYAQTGGAVSSAGAFKVTGPFDQAGGTLAAGNVEVVRPAGDILVGNIRSDNVSLSAPSGAIREAGAIQGLASGPGASLITKSATGTLLNDAGNRLSSFTAENLGTGNIELVNKGILSTSGIRNTGGNITVVNTGGVTSLDTGRIIASGPGAKISLIANSPLTIGAAGVSADGDIELVATNLTSAGNITLNGPIESVAGSVAFTAANDLTQNSSVLAPLGVRAAAGGTLTLGPAATSGYQPVSYQVNSVPVIPPRPPTSTSTTSDLVVALMSIATEPVVDRTVAALEGLASTDKDKDRDRDSSKAAIVSEGQICRP